MIVPGPATRVFLAPGATDLRRSFDGRHGRVRSQLAADPRSGHLFLFCNQARNRLKGLCFAGTGLGVCAKRLARGRFTWPEVAVGPRVRLSAAALARLLGGWERTRVARQNWGRAE